MPIGVELTPAENAALAVALLGYSTRSGSDDFSSLTGFFEKHPKSPGADLLTNLGLEYRYTARTGEAWSKAWALAKGTIEPKVRANADHAAAPFAAANTPPVKAVILAAAAGASSAAPGKPLESGRLVASLALTPYEQWKIDHGLSKDLPDDDDGDGDGIPLLGEFGLGMNPTRPDTTGLPVVSIVGRILQIKYKPVRSDVRYTVEVSTDLINWTTTGVDEAASDSDITAWVPQESDPKKFLRLTVRYVPPVGPNRAPIAQADTANTTIDSAVAISVLANDTDPDGDSLSIVIFGNASNGSVSLSGFQAIYTPNPGYLGNDSFTYKISDGNGGQASATVFIQMAPLPEQGVATSFTDSTTFLYTGQNPVQTNVPPGTIDARRAAVLRGRVVTRDGAPLAAVVVTVLQHPEFGQTLSRTNGMFDLAVNGGGLLTIDYRKSGLLPGQRQVDVPWQDYVTTPDVALTPLDP